MVIEVNEQEIEKRIYTVRGLQVMLDRDLAALYEVKPIRLREQVKRNLVRFPDDFMFQLTEVEIDHMVSQNAIPSRQHLGGASPYVFTEQGVSMLSAVLKSDRAVQVSIQIVRAFVAMIQFLTSNGEMFQRFERVEQRLLEHDKKFDKVFNALEDRSLKPKQGIFYDGQVKTLGRSGLHLRSLREGLWGCWKGCEDH